MRCRDDLQHIGFAHNHLTSDEARRIANGIARLPELLQRVRFNPRGGGDFRWKRSQPFHVALNEDYVREHWDFINAVCKLNSIPFDPTGQRIERKGTWAV